jgi:hypothetical protein
VKCFRHYFEKARKRNQTAVVCVHQCIGSVCFNWEKKLLGGVPYPLSHFELSVCVLERLCVCVDSRYQSSWCFFQGLSFPHPLWPSERRERESRAPSGIPQRLPRLTCAAKHTKKGIFFTYRKRRGKNKTGKRLSAGLEYFVDYIITSSLIRMENHTSSSVMMRNQFGMSFFFSSL